MCVSTPPAPSALSSAPVADDVSASSTTKEVSLADLPQKIINAIIPHAGDPYRLRLISRKWSYQVLEYLGTNKKPVEEVNLLCRDRVHLKLRVAEEHLQHFGATHWGKSGEFGPGENVIRVYAPGQHMVKSLLMDPLRSFLDDWRTSTYSDLFCYYPFWIFLQFFQIPIFLFFSIFLVSTGNITEIRALERKFQSAPRAREEMGRRRIKRIFDSVSKIGVLKVENVNRATLDIIRECLGEVKIGRIEVKVAKSWCEFPRNESNYLNIIVDDMREMAQKHGVDNGMVVKMM